MSLKYENTLQDPVARRNVDRQNEFARFLHHQQREFCNATAGNLTRLLPDGNMTIFDFVFVKVDASANTVTITPYSTQTILGAASLVLTTQYDAAILVFCKATQDWVLI